MAVMSELRVAFKEWAGICRALAEGRQSLIVRKGGIAEGPEGFVPEHRVFWLYPTHLHEAEQGLRLAPTAPDPGPPVPPATVPRGPLAVVDSIAFIDREERLAPLAGLHVWTEETIANLSYPGARKLYIYIKGEHMQVKPKLRDFAAQYSKMWGKGGRLERAGLVPFGGADARRQGEGKLTERAGVGADQADAAGEVALPGDLRAALDSRHG